MTVNKRKKSGRYRGSTTHGCGAMKKRRGSGNKGGAGNAGSGKRADSKKPSNWKDIHYFGKYGFTSKSTRNIVAANIGYIEEHLPRLVSEKMISRESDTYHVDMKKLGFNKLLGSGEVKNKYRIDVEHASKSAIDKVKSGGGEVILHSKA